MDDYDALNRIAKRMYSIAASKGFHPEEKGTVPDNFGSWLANLHSEISELWEAYRSGHLANDCGKECKPRLACAEEELADIVIRAMDTAEAIGVDLGRAIEIKARYNESRAYRHGGKKS